MKATAQTAAARYEQLKTDREPYLRRARECSKLTIPMLIPETTHSKVSKFRDPFQSVGARGVNNLTSKLTITMLPPNAPFFRLSIDDMELEKESPGAEQTGEKTALEKGLAKIERAVMKDIEASGDRTEMTETIRHLIVGGNALLHVDRPTRTFPLSQYVVQRDPSGNWLDIVVREEVAPSALPEDLREALAEKLAGDQKSGKGGDEKNIEIYTWIWREGNRVKEVQECMGEVIPDTDGDYPADEAPWLPLRMISVVGESYGRGYVEEYLGDLRSLEALSQAMVEGTAAAAKVLILVDPNGTTRSEVIAEAPNGAVREGSDGDVSVLTLDKAHDFSVAERWVAKNEQRLEYAFLLHTSIQRDAERVTAEEVRVMANELENALGGVYSLLARDFQLPYVRRRMAILRREGKFKKLPEKFVSPMITTGVEALGRGNDRNKLVQFIGTLAQLSPELIQRFVNMEELISRLAISDGIDTQGLIKSQQQIQQEMMQQQMLQAMQSLGPEAMKQGGGALQQMLQQGGGQGPPQQPQ